MSLFLLKYKKLLLWKGTLFMNKEIKVSAFIYVRTLLIVVTHVIILGLLANYFLPQFQLKSIILIAGGYYLFKVINYLSISYQLKDKAFITKRFFNSEKLVPFHSIKEIELEGPSQFNSNYMVAFYGEKEFEKRKPLVKIPIYWFSRKDIIELLRTIQQDNPFMQLNKNISLYMAKEHWKNLMINYLLQYFILTALIIAMIMKYS